MSNINGQKHATFVISTGRCATQWFADKLAAHYQDLAIVRHEPIDGAYKPRFYFRAYNRRENVEFSKAIKDHLSFIENAVRKSHYIEVGWPAYGALPFIISRLNADVKVIHLYRHPANVAASLTTHDVYSRGAWSESFAISPSDYGVVQDCLQGKKWKAMSQFEKCLFWWTEINYWALNLRKTFEGVPWLSVKYEDVFSENGGREIRKVLAFLSLPARGVFLNSLGDRIDRFSLKTDAKIDARSINNYPKAVELMQKLGYGLGDIDILNMKKRYTKPYHLRIARHLKRAIRCLPQ